MKGRQQVKAMLVQQQQQQQQQRRLHSDQPHTAMGGMGRGANSAAAAPSQPGLRRGPGGSWAEAVGKPVMPVFKTGGITSSSSSSISAKPVTSASHAGSSSSSSPSSSHSGAGMSRTPTAAPVKGSRSNSRKPRVDGNSPINRMNRSSTFSGNPSNHVASAHSSKNWRPRLASECASAMYRLDAQQLPLELPDLSADLQ
jgi:hypothetical protein